MSRTLVPPIFNICNVLERRGKFANPLTPYKGRNPQNRERGFRGQTTTISDCPGNGRFESKKPHFLVDPCRETWTQILFSSNYPGKNPGISRPKVWFPWVSRDIPNFSVPTPSRGPPPHRKISGPESLVLWSFFLAWLSWTDPRTNSRRALNGTCFMARAEKIKQKPAKNSEKLQKTAKKKTAKDCLWNFLATSAKQHKKQPKTASSFH